MSNLLIIRQETLEGIGNAIREKEGSSGLIPTVEMESRIRAIQVGTGETYENGDELTYGEEGYTVTVRQIVGDGVIVTPTKIKINDVPSSSSDYNTATYNGTTYSNVTKVYIWGYSYSVNDEAIVYLGNTSYDNATVLEINSDCEIVLYFHNDSSGGSGD